MIYSLVVFTVNIYVLIHDCIVLLVQICYSRSHLINFSVIYVLFPIRVKEGCVLWTSILVCFKTFRILLLTIFIEQEAIPI